MIRLTSLLFTASLLVGCIHTQPITEDQPCPCAPGWSCDRATQVCVQSSGGSGGDGASGGGGGGGGQGMIASDGSAPAAFGADAVQAALAQCDLPHGPVASPVTYADKRALMLGAWVACPPPAMTVFSPAIVFAANGTWNRLLSDGNGGLLLGYGVQNQGIYSFPFPDPQPTGGNPYVTVAAASSDFVPAEFGDGPMTFETSPTRMHAIITYLDQTIEVWLVRLP